MSVHLHRSRQWMAWILILAAVSPFALCFGSSGWKEEELSPVTGRLTLAGRPFGDLTLCLDHGQEHDAYAHVDADGTFKVCNMRWVSGGVVPGRYKAHFYSLPGHTHIPPKLQDAKTSGLEIDIYKDWNELEINLH